MAIRDKFEEQEKNGMKVEDLVVSLLEKIANYENSIFIYNYYTKQISILQMGLPY